MELKKYTPKQKLRLIVNKCLTNIFELAEVSGFDAEDVAREISCYVAVMLTTGQIGSKRFNAIFMETIDEFQDVLTDLASKGMIQLADEEDVDEVTDDMVVYVEDLDESDVN